MIKDKLDWKIIDVLQDDSRLSFAEIGRIVGLSAPSVKERVQRLEETEVIKAYTTVIDPQKAGYSLSAAITFTPHPGKLKPFLDVVMKIPEVNDCSRMTGSDALLMRVTLRDIQNLEQLIDKLVVYGESSTNIVISDVVRNKKIACM